MSIPNQKRLIFHVIYVARLFIVHVLIKPPLKINKNNTHHNRLDWNICIKQASIVSEWNECWSSSSLPLHLRKRPLPFIILQEEQNQSSLNKFTKNCTHAVARLNRANLEPPGRLLLSGSEVLHGLVSVPASDELTGNFCVHNILLPLQSCLT